MCRMGTNWKQDRNFIFPNARVAGCGKNCQKPNRKRVLMHQLKRTGAVLYGRLTARGFRVLALGTAVAMMGLISQQRSAHQSRQPQTARWHFPGACTVT